KRPTTAHAIASINSHGGACEKNAGAGGCVHVTEYLARGLLLERRRIVPAVNADHRAPSDRTVEVRQGLDHTQLLDGIEFRSSPRSRHRHPEYAGALHRRDDRGRQTSTPLDFVGGRSNVRT